MAKRPKDLVGNELAEGNFVFAKFGGEWVFGVIGKLDLGGLIMGNSKELTKGQIRIDIKPIEYGFEDHPRAGTAATIPVLRLIDPGEQSRLESFLHLAPGKKPQ